MKKYLSLLIAAAMLSTAAIPVSADYEGTEYDIVTVEENYDEIGTADSIDGTKALQIGSDKQRILTTSLNTTQGFYLAFDFRFDSESGYIETPKYKKADGLDVDKVGLTLKYTDGQLTTDTSSTGKQQLGAFSVGEWYAFEAEGRTGINQSYTTGRLYKYNEDGSRELVQETAGLSFRNISSEGRSFNGIGANDVTIDNVKLIEENPDVINITSPVSGIDAGTSVALEYSMTRLEGETAKRDVVWAVYDESGETEITDGSVTVNEAGVVVADINSPDQNIIVKASVVFGENTLTGEYPLTIKAVDISGEKFDRVEIAGDATVTAGTEATYTYKAYKDDTDVTDTLVEGDIVWSIYDHSNIFPIYNLDESVTTRKIEIENGVLKVAKEVVPQKLTIRASSQSGNVFGAYTVDTIFDSNAAEKGDFYYNAFESSDVPAVNKADSFDGSAAYLATDNHDPWTGTNQTGYVLTEMDIKFTANGAGFVLMRRDAGKTNTQVSYQDGVLKTNGGVLYNGADTETWYHIELLYSSSNADASCNIYPYNADGSLGEAVANIGIDRRNGEQYGKLRIWNGACIDNVKISTPAANEISITAPGQFVFTGDTAQFSATVARNGLPIKGASDVTWTVLDEGNLPILDGSVSVSENGLVTVDAMASPQTVTVLASTASGESASESITIQSREIFKIENIGVNEDKTVVEKLIVNKNFYYSDEITFIVAVKDADGVLKGVHIVSNYGDSYNIGTNEIAVNFPLPSDFNPETDKIETMVWTTL